MVGFILNSISYDLGEIFLLGECERSSVRYESCLTIYSLQTQQIEVRLTVITIEFNTILGYTPFHFSRTLP